MAVYRKRIFAVLAKVETVEGTDPVPVAATDAIRTVNVPVLTLNYNEDGNKTRAQHAGLGLVGRNIPTGRWGSIDLVLELRHKNSAYTAVTDYFETDPLIRASGWAKSYAAGTLTYSTLDAGMETITLYLYASNGLLFKLVGCIAKGPKFSFIPGQVATVSFTVIGRLVAAPATTAIPGTLAYNQVVPSLFSGNGVCTLGAGAWSMTTTAPNQLVPRKVEIDCQVQETWRPWAAAGGLVGCAITDRTLRASLDVEAVALTAFDPYAMADKVDANGDTSLNVAVNNVGATQAIVITTGPIQLEPIGDVDLGGLAGWTLAGNIPARSLTGGVGVAAGREISLALT